MKILLPLFVLFTLCGCASLLPTAVNPTFTCVTNDLKALTAAYGGDCTIALCQQPNTVDISCANLPLDTTTVDSNVKSFEACTGSVGSAQTAKRVGAAAAGIKAQLCFTAPQPVVPIPPASPSVKPSTPQTTLAPLTPH